MQGPSPDKRKGFAPALRSDASSAPMRILYSHRTKSADGQYVHIRALTEALAARGHGVFMAGPDDFGELRPRALDPAAGAGGLREALPRPIHEMAEFAYSAPSYLRLRKAARLSSPDILYERYNLFHHSGALLARERRLPFLLEVNAPLAEERAEHGGLALASLARWSERSIWSAADRVLPVSRVLARRIEAAGVPPEKIVVVPNGVEAAFLAETDPGPVRERYGLAGKTVLGFTGFVRSWHGVDRIVRYIAERPAANLHLLLVGDGDGDARRDLELLARALGVAGKLTVTGTVQREAAPAHVAAFDIALQPAVTPYASPLKLFEYMALAKPIVAPASENIREALIGGETALLFDPGDEAGLFRALDRLVSEPDLRRRLGDAARASLLKQDLTWAGDAARIERIAADLIESRR